MEQDAKITPVQVIGGIVAAAGAVGAVLQALPDPSQGIEYAALACTLIAAGGGAFLTAVTGAPRMMARFVATKLPLHNAEERLKAGRL